MKNFGMLTILLIFSAFCSHAVGQPTDAATYFARFITAQKYRLGQKPLTKDTVKALNLYIDCAENGKMPAAMNILGILYQKGMCAPKDLEKAFSWFSKSAEKGNAEGMLHLGTMYKLGEGAAQDFTKAYEYFKASAEKGFPGGMYAAGYCSYKGLGTAQSYDEAVGWFKKGVEKNSPACMYMLGTCYRNGYGIERNDAEAKRLLTIAAEKKVPDAIQELKKRHPEIDRYKKKQNDSKGDDNNNSPAQREEFKKLLKHQDNLSLSGTWTGSRYFYDWSGQHITKEDSLFVILKQSGSKITGQWFENGKLVVNLNGVTASGQILFTGSEFKSENRFGQSYPMQFKAARFESINTDVNYLAGNIDSYSPHTKEPGYPCYVVMSRVITEKSAEIDTTKTTVIDETNKLQDTSTKNNTQEAQQALDYYKDKAPVMTVYPNPFKDEIKITYKTVGNSEVKLYVYSASGGLILLKPLGMMPAGTFTENVQIGSVSGHYVVVKLLIGSEPYTQIVIKQ